MKKKPIWIAVVTFLMFTAACAKEEKGTMLNIETEYGTIKVKLYDETPQHRDNFIKLAKEGFYNGTLFHRVIDQFMIQGGDPDSKGAAKGAPLGMGGPGYTIPAEIDPRFIHKKGALSAARQGDQVNPKRASSGSQFYIVHGKQYNAGDLEHMATRINQGVKQRIFNEFFSQPANKAYTDRLQALQKERNMEGLQQLEQEINPLVEEAYQKAKLTYTEEHLKAYAELGGAPHLDMNYTVFGEVVEGLDIIDKIAAVPVDGRDRPEKDISMKVKVIE